jgi:general secretion pathway protein C
VSQSAVALAWHANLATRLCAGLVWALVTASLVFWSYRLILAPAAAPASTAASSALPPAQDMYARLLGESGAAERTAAEPPAAASRFQLSGIIAPTDDDHDHDEDDEGIALIAVDGRRARAFRVGEIVDAGLRLGKVSQRSAVLLADDGTAPIVLEVKSPAAVFARVPPPLPGAVDFATVPAAPGSPAVQTASSGAEPGPALAPAVDLVQEVPARPPGSTPGTLSPGRRQRLRGLSH